MAIGKNWEPPASVPAFFAQKVEPVRPKEALGLQGSPDCGERSDRIDREKPANPAFRGTVPAGHRILRGFS